jgi:hypothetical protein
MFCAESGRSMELSIGLQTQRRRDGMRGRMMSACFLANKTLQNGLDKYTWQAYHNDNKTCQGDVNMEKEEILEKSRNENKGSDERELSVLASSGKTAAQVGMLACCLAALLQVIFNHHVSFESWMIYFSILGTIFTVKYLKLRRRHELLLAILYDGLFVFFAVLFVIGLIG